MKLKSFLVNQYIRYKTELTPRTFNDYKVALMKAASVAGLGNVLLFQLSLLFIRFVTAGKSGGFDEQAPILITFGIAFIWISFRYPKLHNVLACFNLFSIYMYGIIFYGTDPAIAVVMFVCGTFVAGLMLHPMFAFVFSAVSFITFVIISTGHFGIQTYSSLFTAWAWGTFMAYVSAYILRAGLNENERNANNIQQLYQSEKKLFSDLAHRLKTPMTILHNDLNLEGKLDSKVDATLKEMNQAIDELTVISKMNLSNVASNKEKVSLAELLKRTIHDAQLLSGAYERLYDCHRQLKLTTHLYEDAYIFAAPEQIREAILSIIDNSIRHNSDKPVVNITVGLSSKLRNFVITIEDDGVGMTQQQIDAVLRRSKEQESAILEKQIGLLISQNLIIANRGRLDIKSELGAGTIVEIWLPKL